MHLCPYLLVFRLAFLASVASVAPAAACSLLFGGDEGGVGVGNSGSGPLGGGSGGSGSAVTLMLSGDGTFSQ